MSGSGGQGCKLIDKISETSFVRQTRCFMGGQHDSRRKIVRAIG